MEAKSDVIFSQPLAPFTEAAMKSGDRFRNRSDWQESPRRSRFLNLLAGAVRPARTTSSYTSNFSYGATAKSEPVIFSRRKRMRQLFAFDVTSQNQTFVILSPDYRMLQKNHFGFRRQVTLNTFRCAFYMRSDSTSDFASHFKTSIHFQTSVSVTRLRDVQTTISCFNHTIIFLYPR